MVIQNYIIDHGKILQKLKKIRKSQKQNQNGRSGLNNAGTQKKCRTSKQNQKENNNENDC